MGQQKNPKKKERNYSVWFTGIVLVMAYVILMDSMSGPEEKVCRSLLRDSIQKVSEEISKEERKILWMQEGEEED